MARFWARWYEPATDPWEKAAQVLTEFCGEDSAKVAIAALRQAEFEIEWPFFTFRHTPHMVHFWQSGESFSGSYAVVCALFDAPSEDIVRAEIGECESVDIALKPDDWLPGDRFPLPTETPTP